MLFHSSLRYPSHYHDWKLDATEVLKSYDDVKLKEELHNFIIGGFFPKENRKEKEEESFPMKS